MLLLTCLFCLEAQFSYSPSMASLRRPKSTALSPSQGRDRLESSALSSATFSRLAAAMVRVVAAAEASAGSRKRSASSAVRFLPAFFLFFGAVGFAAAFFFAAGFFLTSPFFFFPFPAGFSTVASVVISTSDDDDDDDDDADDDDDDADADADADGHCVWTDRMSENGA